jgi:hypothetical protein
MIHQEMPCCTQHWWDEDVVAFESELNVLKYPVGTSEGGIADVRVNIPAFLARKKEEVEAIREVSPTSVDVKHPQLNHCLFQHALICAEWDKDRTASRSSKSSDARFNRFEE